MAKEPIVLFQLEVIEVGLAMRTIKVRLPSGESAYIQIPENEARKLRSALEAATNSDQRILKALKEFLVNTPYGALFKAELVADGTVVEPKTRFERILDD